MLIRSSRHCKLDYGIGIRRNNKNIGWFENSENRIIIIIVNKHIRLSTSTLIQKYIGLTKQSHQVKI